MKSNTDKSVNIRLPADLARQLENLATATGRTKSAIIVEALREYLEIEAWQNDDPDGGSERTDGDDFASDEDLSEFLSKFGG